MIMIYIFAELYDYIRCRGILGYIKYDGKQFGKWKPIIIENWHLSYSLIFEYGDDVESQKLNWINHLILYR